MKRLIILLFMVATFSACSNNDKPVVNQATSLTGQEAYETVCAGCHEDGLDGAPKTGDPNAWVGRSWLWESVLFEHARAGYNEMPAKGGEESLNETTVTKAAEYMMSLTYPDLPPG